MFNRIQGDHGIFLALSKSTWIPINEHLRTFLSRQPVLCASWVAQTFCILQEDNRTTLIKGHEPTLPTGRSWYACTKGNHHEDLQVSWPDKWCIM